LEERTASGSWISINIAFDHHRAGSAPDPKLFRSRKQDPGRQVNLEYAARWSRVADRTRRTNNENKDFGWKGWRESSGIGCFLGASDPTQGEERDDYGGDRNTMGSRGRVTLEGLLKGRKAHSSRVTEAGNGPITILDGCQRRDGKAVPNRSLVRTISYGLRRSVSVFGASPITRILRLVPSNNGTTTVATVGWIGARARTNQVQPELRNIRQYEAAIAQAQVNMSCPISQKRIGSK